MTHQTTDQDTPYHGLTKPAFEKDPWDHDYYALVDKIDDELILKDTIANRPSSPPTDSWFLATDEDILYYYDGAWRVIAGSDIQSSSDIDHNSTSGGTVSDAHHSKTVSSDINHNDTQGGTASDAHHARFTVEEVEDAVNGLLTAGSNVSLTYNDTADTLTIDASTLSDEEVEDIVGVLVTSGQGVSVSYDDAGNSLTISVPDGSITETMLSFDTATQSELDSHTTASNPHSASASSSEVDTEIENHRTDETHTTAQPPQTHDNSSHSSQYITEIIVEEDGTVVSGTDNLNFGSNLTVTDDGDGSFTIDASGGSSIQSYSSASALPEPSNITDPTIAYIEQEDDYVGVFNT